MPDTTDEITIVPDLDVEYRHYYGICEASSHPPLSIQVEVHPDAGPDATVPDRSTWEDFGLTCPVCGDTVTGGYDGADDETTERITGRGVYAQRLADVMRTRIVLMGGALGVNAPAEPSADSERERRAQEITAITDYLGVFATRIADQARTLTAVRDYGRECEQTGTAPTLTGLVVALSKGHTPTE